MQISRHFLMTCAVAAFLTSTLAHAADNEAQIRARQALEDKIKQIDAQPPATSVTPAAKPEPNSTPAQPASAVSARPTDNAANDKLSQALHQKMRETESEPAMPAPSQPPEKPKKMSSPAMAKTPRAQPNYDTTPAPVTASTPKFAPIPAPYTTARPALPETPAPATAQTPEYSPIPSSNTVHPALPEIPMPAPTVNDQQTAPPMISLPTLAGPPSSLSAAKQQKLDVLLQQYRMDQLTPQQYHEGRAKILSEP